MARAEVKIMFAILLYKSGDIKRIEVDKMCPIDKINVVNRHIRIRNKADEVRLIYKIFD
jgi:hypothetical protein